MHVPIENPIDPAIDWLSDAKLSPEEREAWNLMRAEAARSRETIRDLEKRIKLLEHPVDEQMTVLTRPEFNREVARMLAFNERYGGISSVLYYNVDGVDEVSTRYGKAVANAAIRQISNTLMRNVRNSDVVGRLAADEFGVLLGRCDNANAWKKGEQLAGLLEETLEEVHGCKPGLKIGFGAYTFHENEDIASGLKEAAQVMTRVAAK
jgi:diguanylate cyclase (GGDEF)-like protein